MEWLHGMLHVTSPPVISEGGQIGGSASKLFPPNRRIPLGPLGDAPGDGVAGPPYFCHIRA